MAKNHLEYDVVLAGEIADDITLDWREVKELAKNWPDTRGPEENWLELRDWYAEMAEKERGHFEEIA